MKKYCTNCGAELEDGAKFCPKCGQAVTAETSAEAQPATAPTSAPTQQATVAAAAGQGPLGQPQHLSFSDSISYIFGHMFEYNSNVRDNQKSIFWYNYLLIYVISVVLSMLMTLLGVGLSVVISIALMALLVASAQRRLNYLGREENLAWLLFIPVVDLYIFYLMLTDKVADAK
ncbi:hypothetical protein IV38_GL001027 [Lactobacillus selangorensis]|uniref:Zinc-ribbon domain-containing protein n=1 Tax=Lactobacillus selangorensis TaxID=81857 RepID=A0A0R2FR16_9LACO|nr:zinc-ribbon domain-containing protein [Lactobacillus selangorensis]KRN28821.1 hypothetical protein IV38_GL001027 [Lactobacillus selangorensis]KRN32769.1 hypothetical protein IV40_GL000827 [Lactobacillus selangorensis]